MAQMGGRSAGTGLGVGRWGIILMHEAALSVCLLRTQLCFSPSLALAVRAALLAHRRVLRS